VAITASAIRADDGALIGFSGIARDISGRMAAERTAARLVESSDDAIVGKDRDGIISTWNPAAERMFGYPADEAIGQSIRLIIPDSHRDEEDGILDRIRRGENVEHFETIRCRKDRSCLPISVTVSPIRDNAGIIIGASKIARDISERKRAEAVTQRAHRESEFVARMSEVLSGSLDYEARLKGVVELAVPALADWGALDTAESDGSIRRLAVAHAAPAKAETDSAIRRRHGDPITPCNARQVIQTGKGVLLPDVTDDAIVAAANGDDRRVGLMRELGLVSCMCVPLTTNHGTFAALTLATAESGRQYGTEDLRFGEDVASRAAFMVDNARAYEALRKTDQLKDEFLATLSHELRTPLNAILGYARMLRAGMLPPDKFPRTFEAIERNTIALAQMVEDILDVSRVVSGKMRLSMQAVELPMVVHDAVATVMPAAEAKHIRLETTIDLQVGPVSGDPDRLRQIVWNLLSNAVKFTPKQGRVQVRLERVNSSVEIVVSDTGSGIAPDFLPHIFERFRQADSGAARQHAGLGLGLAIATNFTPRRP
jgi:PAS domain S-box-containing protein